jgi:insertion element IS1 protein InsB
MHCPECFSERVVKNGSLGNGKPKFKCKDCGRQFVENPRKQRISDETKALIDKLLLEKIPLAGIARVTGVSEPWLQGYVNQKYQTVPRQVNIKKRERTSYDSV